MEAASEAGTSSLRDSCLYTGKTVDAQQFISVDPIVRLLIFFVYCFKFLFDRVRSVLSRRFFLGAASARTRDHSGVDLDFLFSGFLDRYLVCSSGTAGVGLGADDPFE